MKKTVITITADGKIHKLLNKTDKFAKDTNAKINRLTDITINPKTNKWGFQFTPNAFLISPYAGSHDHYTLKQYNKALKRFNFIYDTYEQAVDAEIRLVNKLRLKGYTFDFS
jgi:hypothetical protein